MIAAMYPRRFVAIGGILIAQATGWTLELTRSYVPIVIYAGLGDLIAFAAIQLLAPKMAPARMR
ncbi:hypothetical protein [Erythrobacter donghaensis]|uniref:hypothetical protein n=1 Tax=Erythrobacter donghaensis TaxID=267135 RepID=UPI00117DB3BD|nr:hypothetical protein [Erythrobacter donghaensis]